MSQDRREALRAKLKAKVNTKINEDLDKLTPLRDEMFKKHTQGLEALEQNHYQQALDLFRACRVSLLIILKSPHIKSFDRQFIDDLYGQICLCYFHLKQSEQCINIAREACQHKATLSMERIADFCILENEHELAYQILNIIYLSSKTFHSANNFRMFGSLLFDGYGQVKKTQRYTLAIKFLEEAIQKGVHKAILDLGVLYHRCELAQFRNRTKAIENYTKATNIGNDNTDQQLMYLCANAHNQVGGLYTDADADDASIGPDYFMALYHFKQAEKLNFKMAYYNIAMVYDVKLNKPQKAIPWYQKAIEACQCVKSMHNLAMIHENGEGTPINPTLALNLFCQAADLNYVPSLTRAANMMMMTNTGVKHDPFRAEQYLRKAAELNDAQGLHFLALYIYENRFPSEDRVGDFLSLSLRAAKLGKIEAMYNYAYIMDGRVSQYNAEVQHWYETAGKNGFIPSYEGLIAYLVKYASQLIQSKLISQPQLIEKIIQILKIIAQSSDEIASKIARVQHQQIEQSDQSLSSIVDLFSENKLRLISTLERELEDIASEHKKSRQHRVAGILSKVRNTAWIDINNIALALYHIAKIFEENSSIRDPYEDNKSQIMKIVKVVTADIDKLSNDSLVNIFIGLSKLHLHPDNVIMSACLVKLLPRLSHIMEETIFVNNRRVYYATTRFLLNCEHPSVTDFTLKLLRFLQSPHALVRMDAGLLTECAYFTMIYSHFHKITPTELKETLIKLCDQSSRSLSAIIMNPKMVHQWFMINVFFIQQFGEPLTFIENTLKPMAREIPIITTKSHFEDKVEACLIRLNIKFEREKVINGIPVDFYLPDYDLVLEVNGPRHYLYGLDQLTATPRDIARNKLVGKNIQPICYLDWARWEDHQCCDQELYKIIESSSVFRLSLRGVK